MQPVTISIYSTIKGRSVYIASWCYILACNKNMQNLRGCANRTTNQSSIWVTAESNKRKFISLMVRLICWLVGFNVNKIPIWILKKSNNTTNLIALYLLVNTACVVDEVQCYTKLSLEKRMQHYIQNCIPPRGDIKSRHSEPISH